MFAVRQSARMHVRLRRADGAAVLSGLLTLSSPRIGIVGRLTTDKGDLQVLGDAPTVSGHKVCVCAAPVHSPVR